MRSLVLLCSFGLGLLVAACTDPEPEDLGSFPCGDEECDVRTELCTYDDPCDGSTPRPAVCGDIPEECNGTASATCLDMGGLYCSQGDEGGFSCSSVCG